MGKLVWPEEENEMEEEMEEIDFDSQVSLLYIIFFLCSYCSLIVLVGVLSYDFVCGGVCFDHHV
jgi:hypothetical protein